MRSLTMTICLVALAWQTFSCGERAEALCGDGQCEGLETSHNCPADCTVTGPNEKGDGDGAEAEAEAEANRDAESEAESEGEYASCFDCVVETCSDSYRDCVEATCGAPDTQFDGGVPISCEESLDLSLLGDTGDCTYPCADGLKAFGEVMNCASDNCGPDLCHRRCP